MKKIVLFAGLLIGRINVHHAQELPGLVSKYSFSDGSLVDNVGPNNLTLNTGVYTATDRFGNIFHAVGLDGTSGYLNTSTPFFYPGNDFTISMWFKSENASQSKQTFFNTSPHEQLSVGYNWFGNGTYDIATNDGTNWNICSNAANGLDTFSVNAIDPTTWNHFTMTYDGTTWNSYLNAVLVNTCNTGTPASSISNLYFGSISAGPQSFFAGFLDDIRVFDRALTSQEITQLFNEINPAFAGIESKNTSSLNVFPNPAKDNIEITSTQPTTIKISSILGEEMEILEVTTKTIINLSSYKSGVYFISTENETIRFVKE
jgi:hypothetical protein